jgi:acyl-[acyl-carrier-protein] desaturase
MQASHFLDTKTLAWPSPSKTSTYHRFRSIPTIRFRSVPPVSAVATSPAPPRTQQKTHSLPPEKVELFKSLEGWASQNVLPFLKPVEECWQPSTFLPDPSLPKEEFFDQVRALRDRTNSLPDEYFVVLAPKTLCLHIMISKPNQWF